MLDPAGGVPDDGQERNWDGQTRAEFLEMLQESHDHGNVLMENDFWLVEEEAIAEVGAEEAARLRANVRLLFLGMKHPNPGVPQMRVAYETQELARELGLEDLIVFFNRDWVEFEDRQNYLLDADIGVSTHLDHIETEYSFRTRILDYLWASLPIVATDGDSFATLIRQEGIGEVVAPRDVEGLERALERVLSDDAVAEAYRANIRRIAEELRWSVCLEPLVEFCRAPARAADVACPDLAKGAVLSRLSTGRRRDVEIAMSYLKAGAPGPVLGRVRQRIQRART